MVASEKPSKVALIVAEPTLNVRVRPFATSAIAPAEELHAAAELTSCVLLSANLAIALNWTGRPFGMLGVIGDTVTDTTPTFGITVRVVLLLNGPCAAVIQAVPGLMADTRPELLTAATVESEDVQIT